MHFYHILISRLETGRARISKIIPNLYSVPRIIELKFQKSYFEEKYSLEKEKSMTHTHHITTTKNKRAKYVCSQTCFSDHLY
jgi:hypothetical protein